MKLIINKLTIVIVLIFTTITISCNKNNGSFTTLEPKDLIEKYHKTYFETNCFNPKSHFSIFLDYSGSIKTAFKDNNTLGFYQLFINSIKLSSVDFFEVNNNKIDKIENISKTELYKKVKETDRFKGDAAPLNDAVKTIVDNNLAAVFITDGELWENGERDDPWAREEFENWLKAGNSIEFFITDYLEFGKQKHIFYICFIPKNSNNTVVSDFNFYLENSIEAKEYKYAHFCFTANNVKITKEYNVTNGGVNENAGIDETAFINGENFEFVFIMNKWKDLYKYIGQSFDINGNLVPGGAPLLSHLKVDFSGMEFYNIKDIDIVVNNITDDFNKFKTIEEIKANPPIFATDDNGQQLLDENRLPILLTPGHYEGYDMNGKLIADTIFATSEQNNTIPDLFILDKNIYQQNGEICIKLNDKFSGMGLSSTDMNLLRIDLVLKDVSVNSSNENLDKFVWQGSKVKENRSMYNSILGAFNSANPQNRIIYTYYLYTLPY
ncbi:MAG: hypothetical protein MJ211_03600 [Bacteroidales bacterium]|nr:hypothetical protein [Bacteroidales bacterium]